ncbi:MAG: DUF1987 domain-containing protein [Flavobacteriales bacterium]|jgi:hypothetical protein|nr:DUF1987 domain-containing protein [Flavobacteriales bacterium]
MELRFDLEPTSVTPEVRFDIEELKFLVKGRSMPEDAEGFYIPIINWLKTNVGHLSLKANFDMVLDYYNTGSFIRIMALFNALAELNEEGNEFTIRWFAEEDDQDNIDDGQSFKDVVKVPFEIKVI